MRVIQWLRLLVWESLSTVLTVITLSTYVHHCTRVRCTCGIEEH